MTVITRFAPSPTGHLHVGNLRVAIANALVSKCLEGRFILRLVHVEMGCTLLSVGFMTASRDCFDCQSLDSATDFVRSFSTE